MGPEGVKQHLKALHAAFPDLAVTIEEMVAEGPIVAVRATWRGTPAASGDGQPVQFGGMVFWRIADGKIRERWASIDTAAAQAARASAA